MKKNADKSFTTEEICESTLHGEGGKSTVYRQVSALYKEGAIRRIMNEGSRTPSYQYVDTAAHCESHLHLKCKECGSLIHLSNQTSEILEERILSSSGFSVDTGTLIYGVCGECADKRI